MQDALDEASYVCTTADIWSASNRSFMGMTAHWIDRTTLERKKNVPWLAKDLKEAIHLTVLLPL